MLGDDNVDGLEPFQLKELTTSCLQGNDDARRRFQDLFGEAIYHYPSKMFGLPKDKAADFFIYAFDNDRIFKRLGSFEGRNEAHVKTYLHSYVLHDLFLEWQRGLKGLETISLDGLGADSGAGGEEAIFKTRIEDGQSSDGFSPAVEDTSGAFKDLVARIDVEKRVVWKLLCLAELDLNADEIRFICRKSGRNYREAINLVEEIRHGLTSKDERISALQDQLGSIFGWILLYQKESARIREDLKSAPEKSSKQIQLAQRKEELERKLEWRYRQQRQVRKKAGQFRTTTPYKDIARLLNVPIGTVCSLVARTRAEIAETLGGGVVAREEGVS